MLEFTFSKAISYFKMVTFLLFSLFFVNCAGTLDQELEKLDEIYGYCDNPQRNIRGVEYDVCKAKERAMGPDGKADEKDPLNFTELVEKIRGGPNQTIVNASVNKHLWRSSLEVMTPYELKIADNQGGFIQTEWIYRKDEPNSRCIIKIQISSIELISTGVKASISCQEKINSNWLSDNVEYTAEQKQLTLKILELANQYSSEPS